MTPSRRRRIFERRSRRRAAAAAFLSVNAAADKKGIGADLYSEGIKCNSGHFIFATVSFIVITNDILTAEWSDEELIVKAAIICILLTGVISLTTVLNDRHILPILFAMIVEIDEILQQLDLFPNYKEIVAQVFTVIAIACINFILIILVTIINNIMMIHGKFFVNLCVAYSVLLMYIVVLCPIFTYCSIGFVIAERLTKISNLIQEEIDQDEMDDIICEENFENLDQESVGRESMEKLKTLVDVHLRLCSLAKKTCQYAPGCHFIIIHLYCMLMSSLSFIYITKGHWNYIFLFLIAISTIAICLGFAYFEAASRMEKVFLQLICDWSICRFDPRMVETSNNIILQTVYSSCEFKIFGFFSLKNTTFLICIELIIAYTVFLKQFF